MNIILGIAISLFAYRLNKWYGYERGKVDAMYWRPIHSQPILNLIINLIILGLMILGTVLVFI